MKSFRGCLIEFFVRIHGFGGPGNVVIVPVRAANAKANTTISL